MSHPTRIADFDYDLPPELIAQEPAAERGGSRMLVVRRAAGMGGSGEAGRTGTPHETPGAEPVFPASPPPPIPTLEDRIFSDLPSLIAPGDLVVLNETRVRHARLVGTRPSGAPAEVLLLHPAAEGGWVAMGKPGSALQPGKRIALGDGIAVETKEILDEGYRRIEFVGGSAEEAIERFGKLPLPPYIRHDPTELDEQRYQTVYARTEGSVAAPTAGLHFTGELLQRIERRAGVARLTLDVGPGTFKPVDVDDYRDHPMHPERYDIPAETGRRIRETRAGGGKIWAIGTTVVRALESAAAPDGTVRPGPGETRLMIAPGYQFRVVDRLVTNFHLPRSTLLLLVAAFAGYDTMRAAYEHAVAQRYRFYSYGDAMVIM